MICMYRSEKGLRCSRQAEGTIGMLHLCKSCVAALTGWQPSDTRLDEPVIIQLHDDNKDLGTTIWIPEEPK